MAKSCFLSDCRSMAVSGDASCVSSLLPMEQRPNPWPGMLTSYLHTHAREFTQTSLSTPTAFPHPAFCLSPHLLCACPPSSPKAKANSLGSQYLMALMELSQGHGYIITCIQLTFSWMW